MATVDLDDTEQPMDPMLVQAIEAAYRMVSLTVVEFVPAPRAWHEANSRGGVNGPSARRKAHIKMELGKRDGFQCAYCARSFVDLDDATLDHVIPNVVVGHWQTWNLLLSCYACNHAKSDNVPLVLLPVLCSLLRSLGPLGRRTRDERQQVRRSDRARQRATRKLAQRRAVVRRAIEALSGAPVRLAIEAAPTGEQGGQ
ncbi:HNH endonuclease [Streptomyces sp. NPDC093509]|uniref:HNH endonuclease n=1 Tax=Streptomyces sp. NPDC093509 TaxID=3154982 RepID=UPI00344BB619